MGLYATGDAGKAAAITAIKAAVDARVQTMSDGTLKLDVPSLNTWMWEQALLVIDQDVAAGNKEAAHGVLATIDSSHQVNRLENIYGPGHWASHPEYPTTKSIASSGSFVSAAGIAKDEMGALARAVEAEYSAIVAELPQVISEAWDGGGMGASMPPVEDRIVDTRFYVYTHVNDLGEESAPSPVSAVVEVDQRDTVNISIAAAPSGRNITHWRFYRSNVGTVGAAFQFIAEGPAATLTGTDGVLASEMGEVLPTTTWAEPPTGLRGICDMHNGIMAGFFKNTTAFCEPFVPYAWPVEYQLSCNYPIVAQEAFGQTLVRMHRGGVDFISGADPASMSVDKEVSTQVCVSARSVCKVEGGVVFASPDGLCLANGSGVQVLTAGRILRDDWQAFNPATMNCVYSEGTVYMLATATPNVLALHLPTGRITTVTMGSIMTAAYMDRTTDALYAVSGTTVYRLFGANSARTAVWKSKRMVLPQQASFAWVAVESNYADGPVTVRWYGDGVLRHTATVNSREPVRLPPGRYLEHEVEVESQSRWNALTLASSTAELRGA
ncbi:MAG: hypothetical protein KA181_09170 [Xylophilus sp.]|nr:hypothetical protein [Xylophilus sp.]